MYTFDSRVRYSEIDETGQLSITSVINYLQDCSTLQSEDIGKGVSYLKQRKKAWWLSSWQIVIDRFPALGEHISIGTWPYDFKGMYGYRNFVIKDRQDQCLVRANSIWFFYDLNLNRPVKIQEEDIRGYGNGSEPRLDMKYATRRITVSDNNKRSDAITIEKHHIDTNHHVNNAQYVEMARSLLADDFLIGEVRVEYKKAALFRDIVIPYIDQHEDGYTVSLCDIQQQPYAIVWMKRKD